MKNFILLPFIFLLLACSSCQPIKYVADIAFISPAEANYENFPATINDKICMDIDQEIGRCSKAIADNKDLVIKLPARPYSYRFSLTATTGVTYAMIKLGNQEDQKIDFPQIKFDVPKNTILQITVKHDAYIPIFMVSGRLSPDDREEPISTFFRALISVYDSNFSKRESILEYKENLIMGESALYSDIVLDNGKVESYEKKTAINVKNKKIKMAFSESYQMRFNFKQGN